MNTAYLLTGGNIGDKQRHLEMARELITEQCGRIQQQSAYYETAPWGKTSQPNFINQALKLGTELEAADLLNQLLDIERQIGRIREEKYGPRIIDIDILLFGEEVHNTAFLKVPHPELANRRFALVPLSEIAAIVKHPVLHKTIRQLLDECGDPLEVKKI